MQFEKNNQPDFIFIESEDGTIKIEKIRQMQAHMLEKPIISSKKVYIIKDADTMTKEARKLFVKNFRRTTTFCYNYFDRFQ